MWKFVLVVVLSFVSLAQADPSSWSLEDQAIAEIDRMYEAGQISRIEAEELYELAVETKGAGFYIELDGITYVISFTSAWRCAKAVARTLGCAIATRSISCLATEDTVEIVANCQLRRAN